MAKKATKKKTARKRKPKGVLPGLRYGIACDSISRDPASGKETVYGIFDAIFLSTFPGVYSKNFFILFKLEGGQGVHEVALHATGPDGKALPGHEATAVSLTCKPNKASSLVVQIPSIQFYKRGPHKFFLRSGRKMIGKPVVLNVDKMKTK